MRLWHDFNRHPPPSLILFCRLSPMIPPHPLPSMFLHSHSQSTAAWGVFWLRRAAAVFNFVASQPQLNLCHSREVRKEKKIGTKTASRGYVLSWLLAIWVCLVWSMTDKFVGSVASHYCLHGVWHRAPPCTSSPGTFVIFLMTKIRKRPALACRLHALRVQMEA